MKIAVIVHLFYPEHYEELANCIRNITEPHDLFVTVRSDPAGDELCRAAARDFPEARISRPENIGYDIWPFFSVFNHLNLADYDYIVKLHTKRSLDWQRIRLDNLYDVRGPKWRRNLISFVSSRRAWQASLRRIARPEVGIVAALECILGNEDRPVNNESVELASRVFNRPFDRRCDFRFVGGTMFLAKTSCLAPLQGKFKQSDFEQPDGDHITETISHRIERLFGLCAYSQNKAVVPFCRLWRLRFAIHYAWCKYAHDTILKFFYYKKIRPDGMMVIRILRIPVVRKKLDFSPPRVFVSVVRDFPLYERLVRENDNNKGARFLPFDNTIDNKTIPERYNAFLDSWDYSKEAWFVFLHEDLEFLEPIVPVLRELDKGSIYGITGVDESISLFGALLQCAKDGSRQIFHGAFVGRAKRVSTTDCCCMIVHSSLVDRFHLRFDMNLAYDFYVEDFEMNAREKFGVKTFVVPVCSRHWSHGSIATRFFRSRRYLLGKYSVSKRLYCTTTRQAFGNLRRLVVTKPTPSMARYKDSLMYRIKYRLMRMFWRKRTKANCRYVIKCLGVTVYSSPFGNAEQWLDTGLMTKDGRGAIVPKFNTAKRRL